VGAGVGASVGAAVGTGVGGWVLPLAAGAIVGAKSRMEDGKVNFEDMRERA
jgi:hypothetical protein